MATLAKKFRGNGIYLLDEPEAALSPSRQLAALDLVKSSSRRNKTLGYSMDRRICFVLTE